MITARNQLDLETLGFGLKIMNENLVLKQRKLSECMVTIHSANLEPKKQCIRHACIKNCNAGEMLILWMGLH